MIPISIKNVSKIYPDGTKALNQVSFDVQPGEGVILLGHNGSGKSTLFRCMTGFEQLTEGEVMIHNERINPPLNKKALRNTRKNIGMVFQHFHLIENLSVFQNVLFGALGREGSFSTFSPFASKKLRMQAMECLERVGLSHLAKRRGDQLSGGQKQRVAIARMLMQESKIVLADEPIASLDPKAGREVMDLLWDVIRENGMTVVCVLHQVDIALEYGDRVIGLKKGEVLINEKASNLSVDSVHSLYDHEIQYDERLLANG